MMMMMIIQWFLFVLLIENQLINCELVNDCIYEIEKSNNETIECLGNQCSNYLDIKSLKSLMETCKTSFLSLSFSSYKHFVLFRNNLQYKLSYLFSSDKSNKDCYFHLYLNRLDVDDKPFNQFELIQLGTNIDFYFLFIQNLSNQHQQLIHHQTNDLKWNIIKINTQCRHRQFKGFDEYPCSPYLIQPSIFSSQKLSSSINQFQNSTFPSIINIDENRSESNQFIYYIMIISSTIVLLISLIILIVYLCLKRRCSCLHRNSNDLSSTANTMNNDNNSPKYSISSVTIPHHIDRNYFQNSRINNDEHFNSENLSLSAQQYFVPISSSASFHYQI